MKKFFLSLCLLGSVCFGELYTVTRHQINLTDVGIQVMLGDDIFIAEYVRHLKGSLYLVDINFYEFGE
jgi:hypothetical protein